MFKGMKIGTKINMIFLAILLIFAVVVGFIASVQIKGGIEEQIHAKVDAENKLGYRYLDQTYPGDWKVIDGELYKGQHKISGNEEFVDSVKEMTNSEVTIFLGDERVSTTVTNEKGERQIHTKASAEVIEAVLEKGNSYHAEADVRGVIHVSKYTPIKDAQGEVIGMWFIGYPNSSIKETTNAFVKMLLILIGVLVLLSFIVIFFFSRNLRNRIEKVVHVSDRIANGDITVSHVISKSRDEIGQLGTSINTMIDHLKNLIHQVTNVSETVNRQSAQLAQASNEVVAGSEEISATMQELSAGAESQANHAENLVYAMESFALKIDEANEKGEQVQSSSQKVLKMTAEGYELMENSTEQMGTIDRIVRNAVDNVQELDRQSQNITELVVVIEDIANQTNLLALNAAIEAASAGEHGQGFAVVAEEVRKLAEEVSNSITNITKIVTNIQEETKFISESLQQGYEEVERGTNQIKETGETFKEISIAVEEMTKHIQIVTNNLAEITGESQEMNGFIQEVASISEESSAGIEQTSAASQQTSGAMEEVSNSSGELAKLAEQLNELVQQFKVS